MISPTLERKYLGHGQVKPLARGPGLSWGPDTADPKAQALPQATRASRTVAKGPPGCKTLCC